LLYCLSNDNDNIYIDLKCDNPSKQLMILREGLIIWIDMDNKSLKKLGVRFPLGTQRRQIKNRTGQSYDEIKPVEDVPSLARMSKTIELVGFISEQERHFSSENPDNFRGSVRYEDGTLHYKMVMPLAKLPVRNSKGGNGAMPFALGIEYGFTSDINAQDRKMSTRRNERTPKTSTGSEMLWIKNVKLATSK
jgi:hypothetical protein